MTKKDLLDDLEFWLTERAAIKFRIERLEESSGGSRMLALLLRKKRIIENDVFDMLSDYEDEHGAFCEMEGER